MNAVRSSFVALFVLCATAVLWAQGQPVPPTPPGAPPWDTNIFFKWQEVQSQTGKLTDQYLKAQKAEEKQEIRTKLKDLINQQFDVRMEQQKKELESLEKELTDLRALLKKRQDAKAAIVDRRIDQLIEDAQGMGWNASNYPHNQFWFEPHHGPTPQPAPTPEVNRKPGN
jgi:flagellar motility protein MotE (MotC chaperone)